jgi:hypothetical protein
MNLLEFIGKAIDEVMEEMELKGMITPGLTRGAPAIRPEEEPPIDDWQKRDLRGGG